MAEIVIARSALPLFLNHLLAEGDDDVDGPLYLAEYRLYQNDFTPVGTMVIGDFTVATFDGFAAKAAAWNPSLVNVNGFAVTYADSMLWVPTGTTTPNTIFGYYVTDTGGTNLLYARRFDTPIALTGPTTGFAMIPSFSFGSEF